MQTMSQTSVHLTSVYGRIPLSQQEMIKIHKRAIDSDSNSRRPPPNLPRLDLLTGSGEDYAKTCIPLHEAAIKGDWKSAKTIFDSNRELVRYSLTENGETALHIVVTAKRTKQVDEFVENLVHFMNKEDLTLQNRNYNTALYLASAANNIKAVEIMVKKNEALLTISGGGGQIMPLYAAVLFRSYDVVKYLYKNSHELQAEGWTETNRGLLLEKCVELDFFDVAIQILKDHPELASNGNVLRILAGKRDGFWEPEPSIIRRAIHYGRGFKKECKALQLLKIILKNIAKKPKREIDEILKGSQDALMQATKPDSGTVDHQSLELQKVFSEHFVNLHVETQNIIEQDTKLDSVKKDQAQKLEKILFENIAKMQVKTEEIIRGPAAKEIRPSQVLFIAAERGNTTFIVELIRQYPDLIWSLNDNNQSIFHIAVKNRHIDIYNLLYEIGAMKHMITSLIDDRGNNMLHLAGESMHQKRLEDVPGVALQLQREILWFREIKALVHPSYREQKNEDGLTPDQLFLKEHKDLAAEGARRIKELASQCMVVATLNATMVFTAAFTIPGAYDQNNGIPIFHSKSTFKIFVVADAISLFSSTASVISFLSLSQSRYAIIDFLKSVHKKLMIGLSYLFLSLTSMIIAFCVSFFVLYHHKGLLWIPILLVGFALIPFATYTNLKYFYIYMDIMRSTFLYSNPFNLKKRVLYYQNPQV